MNGPGSKYHQEVLLHVVGELKNEHIFYSGSLFSSDSYPALLPSSQEVASSAITIEIASHIFSHFQGYHEKCL